MREGVLRQGYGGRPVRLYRAPYPKTNPCPGFRARGCGVHVPEPRILCYFCARSSELENGGRGRAI